MSEDTEAIIIIGALLLIYPFGPFIIARIQLRIAWMKYKGKMSKKDFYEYTKPSLDYYDDYPYL